MAHFTRIYHHDPYAAISPLQDILSQVNRTILITGGATGIGFGIAEAFVAASAAKVIIASRNQSRLDSAVSKLQVKIDDEFNGRTIILSEALDMSTTESITCFWKTLADLRIDVDVLVLNATGVDTDSKIASAESLHNLKSMYGINTMGNWHMATAFLAQGKREGKALVHLSSAAAHWNPMNIPLYGTTKAAFLHALQAISDEIPKERTQILSFHPGSVFTGAAEKAGYRLDSIPWDNVQLPAQFAVWAASSQASFLHGRFVWANWDVEELKAKEPQFVEDADFLRLTIKGIETVHPVKMWDQIRAKGKVESSIDLELLPN